MNTITKLGYISALVSFIAIAGYGISQLLQIFGFISFPVDGILIYGFSLCIAAPFMVAVLVLHYLVEGQKRIWSHIALLFAVMYATYASFVYVVQLAVVIPLKVQGKGDSVQLLEMSEHSFFWTLDGLTYICMGIATLFASLAFSKRKTQRAPRLFLLANGLLTPVIAFVYFYPHFSIMLLLFGAPWLITAGGSVLSLAFYFRKKINEELFYVSKEEEVLENYTID